MSGSVGFDSLPYQYVEKCKNHGFQFNVMCVGATGIGKTTLIESLFNLKLDIEPCGNELKTVEMRTRSMEATEGGVTVRLRIVETAGFGDQLDKEQRSKVIVDYVNYQFEAYLREELKVKRSMAFYDDTRIHACLYFISPTGHGLKALDVVTMRELAKRVNIIPIIAKADTSSREELARFKQRVMAELKSKNIETYEFPTDDEAIAKENALLNTLIPFSVIGSSEMVTRADGKLVRARRYPWGIVEVENEEYCDFVKLREAMLRLNEDSLRERTHTVLYERYRQERLREMRMKDGDAGLKMADAFQTQQKEFEEEHRKKEDKLQHEFDKRVEEKQAELKNRDEALNTRHREIRERYTTEMGKLERQLKEALDTKARLEKTLARDGGGSDAGPGSPWGIVLGKKKFK